MDTGRVALTIVIVVAMLSMIGVALAYEGECGSKWSNFHKILCHLDNIQDQNQQIIDKLDWNNCAISHIETEAYRYSYTGGFNSPTDTKANSYKQLVYLCGEMP